jgi:hypothetical protein
MSRIVKHKTFKFKFYWKCSMHNWTLRATNISTNFSTQIGGKNCSENILNIFFWKNSKIECCKIEQIWLFESAILWHFVWKLLPHFWALCIAPHPPWGFKSITVAPLSANNVACPGKPFFNCLIWLLSFFGTYGRTLSVEVSL